jgi:hypothetical protein
VLRPSRPLPAAVAQLTAEAASASMNIVQLNIVQAVMPGQPSPLTVSAAERLSISNRPPGGCLEPQRVLRPVSRLRHCRRPVVHDQQHGRSVGHHRRGDAARRRLHDLLEPRQARRQLIKAEQPRPAPPPRARPLAVGPCGPLAAAGPLTPACRWRHWHAKSAAPSRPAPTASPGRRVGWAGRGLLARRQFAGAALGA